MHSVGPTRRTARHGRDRIVVASNRWVHGACRACPVWLASDHLPRHTWAGWQAVEQKPGHGRLRAAEPIVSPATGGEGQTDQFLAGGPGPSRWDRIVSWVTRNRPTSEAVRDASESLADHLAHYNKTRKLMGQPPVTPNDLGSHWLEMALTPQEQHDRDERREHDR